MAKIEELTEVTAPEKNLMSDNEATRALFRELLGMTGGANASGRGTMHIPDDIMDSMAGDAAQEELARNHLITEMKNRDINAHDPRYVALDLMEMEADNVDAFLATARKKIIKRSKPTRGVCCSRIGGVLDQMLGNAGGEYADKVQADDRGKHDPIGDADDAQTYRKVKTEAVDPNRPLNTAALLPKKEREAALRAYQKASAQQPKLRPEDDGPIRAVASNTRAMKKVEEADLLHFIAEEFEHWEHDGDCRFADPKFSLDEGEQKYFRPAKRPGLLREHFNLAEGAGISPEKAKAALAMLQKKKADGSLTGKEASIMPRLAAFVKMGGGGGDDKNDQKQEENVNMEPSRTASALSSFMESSHNVDRYKAADAGGGKGSPDAGMMARGDAGDLSYKTRDDNSEYDTELMPAKGGGKKTAGQPQSLSTRGKDRGDPIGEGTDEHGGWTMHRDDARREAARLAAEKEKREKERSGKEVSETANALANFMEANGQFAEAKRRLAMKSGDAGDLELNKRPGQRLGSPLESAKAVRAKIGKPRWEDDPEGEADDKGAGKN